MTKNQLFRKIPPKELVELIVKAFGLKSLDDGTKFSKKKLKLINTVDTVNSFKSQLEKYYLPCKARTYLNGLTEKNVITVLRQCIRIYGYRIVSREKYMKGCKFIIYSLCKLESKKYKPLLEIKPVEEEEKEKNRNLKK